MTTNAVQNHIQLQKENFPQSPHFKRRYAVNPILPLRTTKQGTIEFEFYVCQQDVHVPAPEQGLLSNWNDNKICFRFPIESSHTRPCHIQLTFHFRLQYDYNC